jgi:hypothetical protein
MPEHDDGRATQPPALLQTFSDEARADAALLRARQHRHRPEAHQQKFRRLRLDRHRAEKDVAHDLDGIINGHERDLRPRGRAQGIDQVSLGRAAERQLVDEPHAFGVFCTFSPDDDHPRLPPRTSHSRRGPRPLSLLGPATQRSIPSGTDHLCS